MAAMTKSREPLTWNSDRQGRWRLEAAIGIDDRKSGLLLSLVVQKRPSGSIDASWLRLGGRGSSFFSGLSAFRSGSASDEDSGQQRTAVDWRQTMPSSPP